MTASFDVYFFMANLIVFFVLFGLYAVTPLISRRGFLFGVRIPAEAASCAVSVKLRSITVSKNKALGLKNFLFAH